MNAPKAAAPAAQAAAPKAAAATAEVPGALKAVEGQDAPEGFVIKGNQSKKYHVPGSTWYDQTTAEYWFDSVEAAKAAGFEPAGGEARQQIKEA